ncbi:hypothetical protein R82526_01118 [Ralstonia mannitolilytica]|uniref:glycosyltransferase family 87 protein n=1 Tax=Ralstonia mannitolilytica TaxID=105219 RepID=UPI0007B092D2|nr:glycosyltransferase family 87 protein [Ralstonia mannitolilytica]CAJ0681204.1 hypothetical protein R82526_01118 [Ralstonia mannitolilytica]CAJ0879542.1 hypothetical protein R76727_03204 [Ralstonia mannitolilytica]
MAISRQETAGSAPAPTQKGSGWLQGHRLYVYAGALLFIEYFLFGMWWWGHHALGNASIPSPGWDLAVFWSASRVALEHGPAAAYDWALLRAAEAAVLPPGVFGPFPYPPTFLLPIYPLGLLSFGGAFAVVSVAGALLYLATVRSILKPPGVAWTLPAAAFPGVWVALLAGQNSLFTMAAAGAALVLLKRSPMTAGACIALLCVKPQLGVLFPLYLVCSRQWRALVSAACFSLLYLLLGWLAFGTQAFVAAGQSLALFRHAVAENGGVVLYGAPTVFGLLRTAGCSTTVSYLAHGAVAMLVVAGCVWLWRSNCRHELHAASLVIATLVVQPYLMYYDLAWLALPVALLIVDYMRHGSHRVEKLVLLAAWFVPAQGLLAVLLHRTGQWAPVVLMALLAIVVRRVLAARRRPRDLPRDLPRLAPRYSPLPEWAHTRSTQHSRHLHDRQP